MNEVIKSLTLLVFYKKKIKNKPQIEANEKGCKKERKKKKKRERCDQEGSSQSLGRQNEEKEKKEQINKVDDKSNEMKW